MQQKEIKRKQRTKKSKKRKPQSTYNQAGLGRAFIVIDGSFRSALVDFEDGKGCTFENDFPWPRSWLKHGVGVGVAVASCLEPSREEGALEFGVGMQVSYSISFGSSVNRWTLCVDKSFVRNPS